METDKNRYIAADYLEMLQMTQQDIHLKIMNQFFILI